MPIAVLVLGIIIDQVIKIWVKTHFLYGESVPVFGDWFKLYFIENNGMAFGKELFGGSRMGKYILTFFRIGVSVFGFWFLWSQMIKKAPKGLLIAIAFIMAGAVGNIMDTTPTAVLGSKDKSSTCSTPLCGKAIFPSGCRYGVETFLSSLAPSGISPMRASL